MGIRPITTKRYRVTLGQREAGLASSVLAIPPG